MGASVSSLEVTSISGCPPITLTTFTRSTELFSSVYVGTTVYRPASSVTETVTVTTATPVFDTTTVTLPTTTLTATVTTTLTEAATSTINIPTAPGFTPVLCEADFYNPTVIVADTVTQTWPITTYVITPATGNGYVSTTTVFDNYYTTTETVYDRPSVVLTMTETSTISADRTTTIYDACATNNIASSFPDGEFILAVRSTLYNSSTPNTNQVSVYAVDAVECCNACQNISTCTGSAFFSSTDPGVPASQQPCNLFFQQPGLFATCDPQLKAQKAQYPEPITFATICISNSACGQFLLDYTPLIW